MEKRKGKALFVWRITYSHIIAYFIAGLFAVTFLNYRDNFSSVYLNQYMRQVSDPIVALGASLQIIRGFLLGLFLLPIADLIVSNKRGYLKLGLLIFGLSAISTIGPSPGSFEGIIYTILPLKYHLLGLPETLLYILLFIIILKLSYKIEKKYIFILSIIISVIIILFGILGYFATKGVF